MDTMETFWRVATIILGSALFVNLFFAIVIVFFEHRDPKSVWAWLLLLFLLPGVGFVFYLLLGMDMNKRKMFCEKELEDNLGEILRAQRYQLKNSNEDGSAGDRKEYMDLIMYNIPGSITSGGYKQSCKSCNDVWLVPFVEIHDRVSAHDKIQLILRCAFMHILQCDV